MDVSVERGLKVQWEPQVSVGSSHDNTVSNNYLAKSHWVSQWKVKVARESAGMGAKDFFKTVSKQQPARASFV